MSGFDPDWLDLREAADHAARLRAEAPFARFRELFGGRDVRVADIGAGSGSTLRALAPHLGARQRWTLIDNDPALLAHARDRLARWADDAYATGSGRGPVTLRKGPALIEAEFELGDLAADPLPASAAEADLVSASALFDLVGARWLEAFLGRLASAGKPLYAALTYSGRKTFAPPHRLDAEALAAFNRDMARDKGLGQALGPAAGETLARRAAALGFEVAAGESPWTLGPEDAPLIARLADGMAEAAARDPSRPEGLAEWRRFRLDFSRQHAARVEHSDFFLSPSRRSGQIEQV